MYTSSIHSSRMCPDSSSSNPMQLDRPRFFRVHASHPSVYIDFLLLFGPALCPGPILHTRIWLGSCVCCKWVDMRTQKTTMTSHFMSLTYTHTHTSPCMNFGIHKVSVSIRNDSISYEGSDKYKQLKLWEVDSYAKSTMKT